jgi:putative flippase GtrA
MVLFGPLLHEQHAVTRARLCARVVDLSSYTDGASVKKIVLALLRFAVISGVGLLLDFGVFFLLVRAGRMQPTASNMISATVAVAFVYFASISKVFSYQGDFLLSLFLVYLGYQVMAVALASIAVGYLAAYFASPGWAKLAVLPMTFGANFAFMSLLTRRGRLHKGRSYGT